MKKEARDIVKNGRNFKEYDLKKNDYLDDKSKCHLVDVYMRLNNNFY